VITGAGVSAESGIPTFRGKGGYWRNFNPAKLATPEAFDRDSRLVWEWYLERRANIREAQPNRAHEAITKLANRCDDLLLVTQNVDDLHKRARFEGDTIPSEKIVQIHGDIFLTRCSTCDWGYQEAEQDTTELPLCRHCGAMMRPGVVWFGEMLDPNQIARVELFLEKGGCDVVLVVGTTAMFGYIVDWTLRAAENGGQSIEVNPDTTSLSPLVKQSVREPAGVAVPRLVDALLSRK
jgi:NAD-dependent deacetylase